VPRLWGSTNVLNVLEKLGYVTDASFPLYYYRKAVRPVSIRRPKTGRGRADADPGDSEFL